MNPFQECFQVDNTQKKTICHLDSISYRDCLRLLRDSSDIQEKAKALWDGFEFVYTPKHGSWLNMVEIELNVLTGQCLKRRIDNISDVKKEALAWQKARNTKNAKVNWQFTAKDARIKLKRLYPTLDS